MTKEEKQKRFNLLLRVNGFVEQGAFFWEDPEEKTYMRGLFLYPDTSNLDFIVDFSEIIPDLDKRFKFVGGALNILRRKATEKRFHLELINVIRKYCEENGFTYEAINI